MKYDYMVKKREKLYYNAQDVWQSKANFLYKDYTLFQEMTGNNKVFAEFIWDPTAGDATKPLIMNLTSNDSPKTLQHPLLPAKSQPFFYAHDANKNVTEIFDNFAASPLIAHYEYDAFGKIALVANGNSPRLLMLDPLDDTPIDTSNLPTNSSILTENIASINPFRFSSEYHDSTLALVYYNYRHYNPNDGRWLSRDPIAEKGGYNLYGMCKNNIINSSDFTGLTEIKITDDFNSTPCALIDKGDLISPATIPGAPGKAHGDIYEYFELYEVNYALGPCNLFCRRKVRYNCKYLLYYTVKMMIDGDIFIVRQFEGPDKDNLKEIEVTKDIYYQMVNKKEKTIPMNRIEFCNPF